MTNNRDGSGWHNALAVQRVIEFMSSHDMSASVYESMTDHDSTDARIMHRMMTSGVSLIEWVGLEAFDGEWVEG